MEPGWKVVLLESMNVVSSPNAQDILQRKSKGASDVDVACAG